ncbi:MAG: protease [Chlamydia sp. 32-24]|nr:MAG: protease [Chlamydia sp. 32-24]
MNELKGKKILFFVHNEYEDLELNYPLLRMKEAGAVTCVAGPEANKVYEGKHGVPCKAEKSFEEVSVNDFDALIIPGGYAPDKIRMSSKAISLTNDFFSKGKLVAFICHAGWVPISAKIVEGIKCTSWKSIKDDLVNAGANWVDEAVVVDKNVISSRCPDDLPQFCQAIISYLKK